MTKRNRKNSKAKSEMVIDDKPDWAMDRMVEPVKKKAVPEKNESDVSVMDRINSDVANSLTKLKERMEAQEVKQASKPQPKRHKTAAERLVEDPNLTFRELFDPVDEDKTSFADLLDNSKLDWRSFKGN